MPKGLQQLIGLNREKELVRIDILACLKTGEIFPNTLVHSLGGLGKTTFARAIGEELNYYVFCVEAAALKTRESIIETLEFAQLEAKKHKKNLLFFIDEVHRFSTQLQEVFYYLMESKPQITTPIGVKYFDPFCFIAATTRFDMLDQDSFVKRFSNVVEIERYSSNNIQALVVQWFASKNMTCDTNVPSSIAQRSLGIPRIAVQLCNKIRVNALSDGRNRATIKDCNKMYALLNVDSIGLSRSHRKYLQILADFIKPQGISTISGKLGQNPDVVESTIEPVLLSLGFIERTARGRAITPKGNEHIQNS